MSNTTQKEITIAGFAFPVSIPFAEGHVCTEAEAKALNQTRCENVRNNMAKFVKEAKNEEDEIDEATLAELTAKVTAYDNEYVFTLANVGTGRTAMDPVEKEANKIARELIVAALKSAGRKVGDVDKDKLAEAVATKAQDPVILKAAKKRVDDRKKNAETVLEGLDLGDTAEE